MDDIFQRRRAHRCPSWRGISTSCAYTRARPPAYMGISIPRKTWPSANLRAWAEAQWNRLHDKVDYPLRDRSFLGYARGSRGKAAAASTARRTKVASKGSL
jgi:hypothetical protein